MRFLIRGTMAHILLKENTSVVDIVQDIMLRPPEKYTVEFHFDENHELISLIIMNCGASYENIIRILNFFVKKYEKMTAYDFIAPQLANLIKEFHKVKPVSPKNLFRFDLD
ncbi:MAG: hypothetical protein ACTSRS_00905 [Candidatus Helarchaeota archaeon]